MLILLLALLSNPDPITHREIEVLWQLKSGPVLSQPWDDGEVYEDELEYLIKNRMVKEVKDHYKITKRGLKVLKKKYDKAHRERDSH